MVKFKNGCNFLFSAILLMAHISSQANIDDSGLTEPGEGLQMSVSSTLSPSEIVRTPLKANKLSLRTLVKKGNVITELMHLSFVSSTSCKNKSIGEEIIFQTDLANDYLNIKKNSSYRVEFSGTCGYHHDLIFDSESPEGQAVIIWEVGNRAVSQFSQIDRLDFWGGVLQVEWPSSGDFYNWGTVHLTRGDYWDVVGHEIGHAIYDRANIGVFGGGQHFIDQCYTTRLALSEGWASFFSAWISLDLNDAHAQFEFMVPRRAPLGVETVPEDVCNGPTNEWRVYAFLWDIIDINEDGEVSGIEFRNYWDLVYNQNVRDIRQQMNLLIQGGVDINQLQQVWELNFKTSPE